MSRKLKVTRIGNSAAVVLPKDLLHRLGVEHGDVLYALETPRGIEITPKDPELASQAEIAERVMQEDCDLLKKLSE